MSGPHAAVIIGAGVIGCSIATDLARRGHAVTVIDRGAGAGTGSTSASSAIIRFHYSTVSGTALAYEGLHYWRNWTDHLGIEPEGGPVHYIQTGMAGLVDQTGHAARCKPILDQLGIPNEWWDTDELKRRMPYLDAREFWPPRRPDDLKFYAQPDMELQGALYEPEGGYVSDPQQAAANLKDAAVAAGATFRFGATVTGVRIEDDRVAGVELVDGTVVEADIVVNAAGPHSSHINQLAGVAETMSIGTRPLRQEVHIMPGPEAPAALPVPAFGDGDSGFYFRPDLHGNILVGSVEPDCDPLHWLDDPDEVDPSIGDEWDVMTLRVARRIPELGVPHQRRGTVGVYDASDDWIPIYDRTDLDGFYVAIGPSGNQFKNAGPVGFLMAELIEAVEDGHDHDNDPVVITGPHTGFAIDVGTFRRNRSINRDSSMSVRG
ncbi:MAG: FAD-dependent oxidoreductase [Actinomycetota bacterium]